jgi:hypothetical protein
MAKCLVGMEQPDCVVMLRITGVQGDNFPQKSLLLLLLPLLLPLLLLLLLLPLLLRCLE